jgi:hypothetical protein
MAIDLVSLLLCIGFLPSIAVTARCDAEIDE